VIINFTADLEKEKLSFLKFLEGAFFFFLLMQFTMMPMMKMSGKF